jgi:hypothetical protein
MSWIAVDEIGTICEFRDKPVRIKDSSGWGQWSDGNGCTVHPPIINKVFITSIGKLEYERVTNKRYLRKRFGIKTEITWKDEPVEII